jgi:hypothetical protein
MYYTIVQQLFNNWARHMRFHLANPTAVGQGRPFIVSLEDSFEVPFGRPCMC